MAETKFTPGPWVNDDGEIIPENGSAIALVHNPADSPCFEPETDAEADAVEAEFKANADLIAAAPDLYAFIERFAAVTQGRRFGGGPEPMRSEELDALPREAAALLARARGEGSEATR
jgi:hypothetical protein